LVETPAIWSRVRGERARTLSKGGGNTVLSCHWGRKKGKNKESGERGSGSGERGLHVTRGFLSGKRTGNGLGELSQGFLWEKKGEGRSSQKTLQKNLQELTWSRGDKRRSKKTNLARGVFRIPGAMTTGTYTPPSGRKNNRKLKTQKHSEKREGSKQKKSYHGLLTIEKKVEKTGIEKGTEKVRFLSGRAEHLWREKKACRVCNRITRGGSGPTKKETQPSRETAGREPRKPHDYPEKLAGEMDKLDSFRVGKRKET